MGQAESSELASEIIDTIKPLIRDPRMRKSIYLKLIDKVLDKDCDRLDECTGADPAFDAALKEVCPPEENK